MSTGEACTRKRNRNEEKWLCLVEKEELGPKMLGGGGGVDGTIGSEEREQNEAVSGGGIENPNGIG